MNAPDPANAQRLSVERLVAEFRNEFASPDRGFLHTAKRLALAPGATLAAVWRGETQGLTSPFRFFVVSYTLYALAFLSTGAMDVFWADMQQRLNETAQTIGGIQAVNPGHLYLQHPFVTELGIVTLMFLSTWIWYRRPGLNAAERAAMPLYWYGFINLIQAPFFWLILIGYTRQYGMWLSAVSVLYIGWATYTLIEPRSWRNVARGLGWWLTAILVWPALVGLVMGLTGGFTKAAGGG